MTPTVDPILFVGEGPSLSSDPCDPILSGASGTRLRSLAGARWDAIFARATFVNVFGSARPWDARAARYLARNLLADVLTRGDVPHVVLFGRRVARSFLLSDRLPVLEWARLPSFVSWRGPGLRAVVFPHPSGKSRWWNDARNAEAARVFLRDLALSGRGVDAAREAG